jgi:predicted transglutaminase-like cysteine proteinase
MRYFASIMRSERMWQSFYWVLAAALCAGMLAAPQSAWAINAAFISSKGRIAPPSGATMLCQTYDWACAVSPKRITVTQEQFRVVRAVNSEINRRTRSIEDRRQYGTVENWALPTRRGGDCEDFALAKKRELIRLGIDPQRLLIATVLDRKRNPHAVLVFRSDRGDLILDNLTNKIKPWQATRYLFLRMQDPETPSRWMKVFLGG